MAEFPAMPFWTDAYLGDTSHLTTTEHGAYLLLLIAMWRSGEARLPADDRLLARHCRGIGHWHKWKPIIMPFFTPDGEGYITQLRLKDEWSYVKENSRRQSNKAKARWLKNKKTGHAAAMPMDMPGRCRTDAPIPTPTPTKKGKFEIAKNLTGFLALPGSEEFEAWKAWTFANDMPLWRELMKRQQEGRAFDFETRWPPNHKVKVTA